MCKGVLDATLCDEELSVTCSMSMDSPISSTNKTECHYITEILLKVTLSRVVCYVRRTDT